MTDNPLLLLEEIKQLQLAVHNDSLIALPTDTVFGIGCSPFSGKAIDLLYHTKKRARSKSLALLCKDLDQAKKFGKFSAKAEKLATVYWPGALTIIVPLKEHTKLASNLNPGLKTIGLRVPNHKIPLLLTEALNHPIAATSANISGKNVLKSKSAIQKEFGLEVKAMTTYDPPKEHIASTIVSLEDGKLSVLREGSVQIDNIFF